MGGTKSRLIAGDDDVTTCKLDVNWVTMFAGQFEDIALVDTAVEAIADLDVLGVDVARANTMLGIQRHCLPEGEHGLIVHSYAMNDPPVFDCVSSFMNDAVKRSTNPEKLKAAMKWQKLLDHAVLALPDTYDFQGEAYRGMKFAFPDVRVTFPIGKIICWYVFKSTTTDAQVLADEHSAFCGTRGRRTVFVIKDVRGKNITDFSPYDESEVLLCPLTFLEIIDVKPGDHLEGDPFEHADIITLKMLDWRPPRRREDVRALLDSVKIKHEKGSKTPAHVKDPSIFRDGYRGALKQLEEETNKYFNWRARGVAKRQCENYFQQFLECGQLCLSWSDDGTLKIWSLTTGQCEHTLTGHTWAH
eukprot:TRINITY_DN12621_c0_g1_i1.p1 TRINITY_DN12621_c0_g1~~TRINITY_DN12621_c0_g1_i1.p1  ORF type:complete len:359 (-),score=61.81 TRINITY_DN12621_c0_g1_i1:298-1374(-)